jgi:uncharacterized protein YdaU (DUF1376 family)
MAKRNARGGDPAPAFQFYARDWLADEHVLVMTLEEEGIYIRLLALCWQEGSIPADPAVASRLAKFAPVEAVKNVLLRFTPSAQNEQRLVHLRLDKERKKQREFNKQRSEAGRKSGEARSAKRLAASTSVQRNGNGRSFFVERESNSTSASASTSTSASLEENAAPPAEASPKPVEPPEVAIIVFPVVGGSRKWGLVPSHVETLREAFPGVDVIQEARKALAWVESNNKKTAGGMPRFLFTWMSRANDSRRGSGAAPAPADPRGNIAAAEAVMRRLEQRREESENEQG